MPPALRAVFFCLSGDYRGEIKFKAKIQGEKKPTRRSAFFMKLY